jgi:glycyl-tRNA synthetase beta chain
MVGEFPELQGLMGMYYARAAGLPDAVALAARDHYSPLGPSDAVPTDPVSVAVALADKIDTLTGFWAYLLKPTGSADPFALRRAVLGVARTIQSNGLRLGLLELFERMLSHWRKVQCSGANLFIFSEVGKDGLQYRRKASRTWTDELNAKYDSVSYAFDDRVDEMSDEEIDGAEWKIKNEQTENLRGTHTTCYGAKNLLSFFHDRLKVFLKDQGIRHDVIDACLAMPGNDDLTLLVKRAEALAAFLKTEDGPNLLQGYKRANTILSQAEAKDGVEYSFGADIKFAETDEERALFTALDAAEAAITPAMTAEDFPAAMAAMAQLRAPIDAFFTAVQVNADNQIVRRNRLNLLHRIRAICSGVADLTKIEG